MYNIHNCRKSTNNSLVNDRDGEVREVDDETLLHLLDAVHQQGVRLLSGHVGPIKNIFNFSSHLEF